MSFVTRKLLFQIHKILQECFTYFVFIINSIMISNNKSNKRAQMSSPDSSNSYRELYVENGKNIDLSLNYDSSSLELLIDETEKESQKNIDLEIKQINVCFFIETFIIECILHFTNYFIFRTQVLKLMIQIKKMNLNYMSSSHFLLGKMLRNI